MNAPGQSPWDPDPTIWRLAADLIAKYGARAPDVAAEVVEKMVERGEEDRARTWTRMMKAARLLLESKGSP